MRPTRTWLALAASGLVLGACARVDESNRQGEPEPPYNMVDPVSDSLRNAADSAALGEWRRGAAGEQASTTFSAAGGEPLLRLACDERRGLVVERLGAEPVAGIDMIEIRIGPETRRLAADPLAGSAVIRTVIPYNDPLIARLTVPEGSFAFASPDAPAIDVPLNDATAALVAECRTPTG